MARGVESSGADSPSDPSQPLCATARRVVLWGAALALAALFWPQWDLVPVRGADLGWRDGLAWAAELGLQWGRDLVFSYGPLGYTLDPRMQPVWQLVVASALHVAGVVLLVWVLLTLAVQDRRPGAGSGLFLAGVAAIACLGVAGICSLLLPVVLVASLRALVARSTAAIALTGVTFGVLGHQKLSEAALALGFAALCALGASGWRGLAVFSSVAGTTWLAVWVACGQSLANLPRYLSRSLQFVGGYPMAMSLETVGYGWHYAAAGLVAAALTAQAVSVTSEWPRPARWCLVMAVLWALWLALKSGFVRHDSHDLYFFAVSLVLATAMLLLASRSLSRWVGGAAAAGSYLLLSLFGSGFLSPGDRTESLSRLRHTLGMVTSEAARVEDWHESLRRLSVEYELAPEVLAALGPGASTADPWDVSAIRLAGGGWDPLPTLQLYAAYTPELDAMNVASLRARPRAVLRPVPYRAIDGRNPAWESPGYQQLLYCEYGLAEETSRWQVLRTVGGSRCRAPEAAGSVRFHAGAAVAVPRREGSITFATITPSIGWSERVEQLLLKAPEMHVTYGPTRWRLAESPTAGPLLLNAPVPQPSFPGLPRDPLPTIAFDHDGRVDFSFVVVGEMKWDAQPTDGTPSARGLAIAVAERVPATSFAPTLEKTARVVLGEAPGCARLTPGGEDPWVVFTATSGSRIYVVPEQGGEAQVFVRVAGEFSEAQSRRFTTRAAAPYEIRIPARLPGVPWTVRVDPPLGADTLLCVVEPVTAGAPRALPAADPRTVGD